MGETLQHPAIVVTAWRIARWVVFGKRDFCDAKSPEIAVNIVLFGK